MDLREKIIRNLDKKNTKFSEDTKLALRNGVMALDIGKKIAELASKSTAPYAEQLELNKKLKKISEILGI